MEDPLLAARCKIFAAYSLLQRGRLKEASKIIRSVAYLIPMILMWERREEGREEGRGPLAKNLSPTPYFSPKFSQYTVEPL